MHQRISHPRRTSLSRRVAIVLLGILGALALWAIVIEPGRLVRHDVTITSERWPSSSAPIRLAVVGDIHLGAPHIDLAKLDTVVRMVNEASPDAVLLLGDYVIHGVVGGRFLPPEQLAPKLSELRSRFGTFAVLGNHDWWFDGERVRRALQSANVRVLENEAVAIDRGDGLLFVAGLADQWTRRPDIPETLADVPAGAAVILMMHEPDLFPDVPHRVSLTLAAHTHGGQVRLPFYGPPIVPSDYGRRYAAGHVVEGGRHLFVTTGIGTSIIPVRLGVPPEVAIVTVVSR